MQLAWPRALHLASYADALERGWSPDNRRPEAAREELDRIARDPDLFVSVQVDREVRGDAVVLSDGSRVARLPGYRRWMWDGEYCGVIGLRRFRIWLPD